MKKRKKKTKKNYIKHAAFEDLNISSLEDHKREGGILLPPLAQIPNSKSISWRDHGLNEVLWAIILRGNLNQRECLDLFRGVIINVRQKDPEYKNTFISHSALSALTEAEFDVVMQPIVNSVAAKELLSALLYFDCLPDHQH